jgi:hypothetical protein
MTLDERCRNFLTRLQRQRILAPASSSGAASASAGSAEGDPRAADTDSDASSDAEVDAAAEVAGPVSGAAALPACHVSEPRLAPAAAPEDDDGPIIICDLPAAASQLPPPTGAPLVAGGGSGGGAARQAAASVLPGSHCGTVAEGCEEQLRYGFPAWYRPIGIHIPPGNAVLDRWVRWLAVGTVDAAGGWPTKTLPPC